jgi:hypothetical protein
MPLPGFVFVFAQPRLKVCDGCMDGAGTDQVQVTVLGGDTPLGCQSAVQQASAVTAPIGPIAECANVTSAPSWRAHGVGRPVNLNSNKVGTQRLIIILNCIVTDSTTRSNKVPKYAGLD